MTKAGAKARRRLAATAALFAALVASLAVAIGSAAAEPAAGPKLPQYGDGMGFGVIEGPADPEEFSWQVQLGPEQTLRQVSETLAVVEWTETGHAAFDIVATEAADAVGAKVPTTLRVSAGDVVTLIVHHREGNPAADGAPFTYPIVAGPGWEGGFHTSHVPMPPAAAGQAGASPTTAPPAPPCVVPRLRRLSLRAARSRLRAAHCSVGKVHLARHATRGKGRVVKQFRPPGRELAAGAPVAVKLGWH